MERQKTIGLISPLLGGFYNGNVIIGIYEELQKHGYRLIGFQGAPSEFIETALAQSEVDGWIAMVEMGGIESLVRQHVPLVITNAQGAGLDCPSILPDNKGGAFSAITHLIEHGHRRIAFAGFVGNQDIEQRFLGYKEALAHYGIPFDPDIFFSIDDFNIDLEREVAQRVFATKPSFTAMITGYDRVALMMIEAARAHGYRVPEDFAFIGFDDDDAAQFSDPPLTTVRQKPDAIGRGAAALLVEQIAGRQVDAGVVHVPTNLVVRHSCGCDTCADKLVPTIKGGEGAQTWQDLLAWEMVNLLHFPLSFESSVTPESIWPDVRTIIQALELSLQGEIVSGTALRYAWLQAITFSSRLEALNAILDLLGQTGSRLVAEVSDITVAQERMRYFLSQAQLEMMRARSAYESQRHEYLDYQVIVNYTISMALFGNSTEQPLQLGWLHATPVNWGCLALWDERTADRQLIISGVFSRDGNTELKIGTRYPARAFPPTRFFPESVNGAGPDIVKVFQIRTDKRDWGLLVLCGPIERQFATQRENMAMWAALLGGVLEREALLRSLAEQQGNLQSAYERERELSARVRELGSPIIPLLAGVLLVPIVGAIDAERAQQIVEAVLEGVSAHQATSVLLDITGVPLVDTQVANSLIQTARATTLLGAQASLVGVRPEIAQSIVGLGIDLRTLTTYPTLAAAIRALQYERFSTRGK